MCSWYRKNKSVYRDLRKLLPLPSERTLQRHSAPELGASAIRRGMKRLRQQLLALDAGEGLRARAMVGTLKMDEIHVRNSGGYTRRSVRHS
ncbi:MAG: hypothetical protein K2X64_00535 [Rhodocyclaceae bacterium]|nr:hypothetical protein [Rhodocyclaceae bacterium]